MSWIVTYFKSSAVPLVLVALLVVFYDAPIASKVFGAIVVALGLAIPATVIYRKKARRSSTKQATVAKAKPRLVSTLPSLVTIKKDRPLFAVGNRGERDVRIFRIHLPQGGDELDFVLEHVDGRGDGHQPKFETHTRATLREALRDRELGILPQGRFSDDLANTLDVSSPGSPRE